MTWANGPAKAIAYAADVTMLMSGGWRCRPPRWN